MLKIVIVEDQKSCVILLQEFLVKYFNKLEVVGIYNSVSLGIAEIPVVNPDIVFMDVEIIGGTSFEILEHLQKNNQINFELIFITAFGREYSTRAMEFSALEYINKPVDEEDAKLKLHSAIIRAENRVDKKVQHEQIKLLLSFFKKNTEFGDRRIALHLLKGIIQFVDLKDIIYLETDEELSKVSLTCNRRMSSTKNLSYYSKLLTTEYNFFQISQSCLVNVSFIEKFVHSELEVTLKTGEKLYASRRGGKMLKDFLIENNEKRLLQELNSVSLLSKICKFFE